MSAREKELLERIRQLEEQNSALQDKLDMIWAVLAPDYDDAADFDDEGSEGAGGGEAGGGNLVQIDMPTKKPS